ncbi:MAG: hypothetical protein GTO46_03780 [Gemmatimonadetes bacterium]|nr:hypothetical protein [Gemmatimonadota bacterium]NIO32920.1 hypothetical protein [Gemmatimonadota bacterium]
MYYDDDHDGDYHQRDQQRDWVEGTVDWPRGRTVMREIADRLAASESTAQDYRPVRYFWPGLLPRNLLFLIVVFAHGLRRLAPPY